jgi:hypothetical protein
MSTKLMKRVTAKKVKLPLQRIGEVVKTNQSIRPWSGTTA